MTTLFQAQCLLRQQLPEVAFQVHPPRKLLLEMTTLLRLHLTLAPLQALPRVKPPRTLLQLQLQHQDPRRDLTQVFQFWELTMD
jgi:hypothetical protein